MILLCIIHNILYCPVVLNVYTQESPLYRGLGQLTIWLREAQPRGFKLSQGVRDNMGQQDVIRLKSFTYDNVPRVAHYCNG